MGNIGGGRGNGVDDGEFGVKADELENGVAFEFGSVLGALAATGFVRGTTEGAMERLASTPVGV